MLPSALLSIALLPYLVPTIAYSFNFTSTPQQCATLSLEITGSGGSPPYRALILPWGASPLPNNIEARRIVDVQFNDTSSLSFQLRFPANSQFVAVVSDSNGFGTGGTSVTGTVLSSSDSSCFDATINVAPLFWFDLNPENQLVQCQSTRLWWDSTLVNGTVSFQGIIPGGQSFTVPAGTISSQSNYGTGFSWTPSIRGGTTVELVASDDRGTGSGGSTALVVSSGSSPNSNCLNANSPSSTPGSPAGGTYPTSTSGAGTGGNNSTTGSPGSSGSGPGGGHSADVGAIVGGVIGGLASIAAALLVLVFCFRRRKHYQTQKERPVDLLQGSDDDHDEMEEGRREELPHFYRPEPFLLPDPTVLSSSGADEDGGLLEGMEVGSNGHRMSSDRRASTVPSLVGLNRPATPDRRSQSQSTVTTTNPRKSQAGPAPMRPMNIIQHEDAGPPPEAGDASHEDTIELPPAYTNLRSTLGSRTAGGSGAVPSVPEEEVPRPPSAAA